MPSNIENLIYSHIRKGVPEMLEGLEKKLSDKNLSEGEKKKMAEKTLEMIKIVSGEFVVEMMKRL